MSDVLFVEAVNGVLINATTIRRVVLEDGQRVAIDNNGFRWPIAEPEYRKLRGEPVEVAR